MANALPGSKNAASNGVHGKPLPHGLVYWDDDDEPQAKAGPSNSANGESEVPTEISVIDPQEYEQLRAENVELRQAVAELHQLLEETTGGEQNWAAQQKEYENLLEEKSEVIRTLHQKLQEFQDRPQAPPVPREEELIALSDELERERCKMQQERRDLDDELRQLKEDEEALMEQMRQMEVGMSRERAELARQRNELQRLHAEIRHELELASRDAHLRERLMPLQRRHQEMLHRKGSEPTRAREPDSPPRQAPPPEAAKDQKDPKDSSLLRRFFG